MQHSTAAPTASAALTAVHLKKYVLRRKIISYEKLIIYMFLNIKAFGKCRKSLCCF